MDIQYLLFLQNLRESLGGCFDTFFMFISTIGAQYYIVVPALILFWAVDKKKGMTALGAYGTVRCLNAFLKLTFCVYRPWIRSDQIKPLESALGGATGYSFPSGHGSTAGAFYGGLISAFRKYRGLCIFFGIMILLTMFSRNYVGVHTPQDVLVGAAIGLFSAFLMTKLLKLADRYRNADIWIFVVSCAVCVCLLIYFSLKQYPMDYVNGQLLVDPKKMIVDGFKDPGVFFGVITGWFLERRFIRFRIEGTTVQKVTRCLVGGLLYVFYYTTVIAFVGKTIGSDIVHFLLQMSGPLLFMTVYPLIFTKLQKADPE